MIPCSSLETALQMQTILLQISMWHLNESTPSLEPHPLSKPLIKWPRNYSQQKQYEKSNQKMFIGDFIITRRQVQKFELNFNHQLQYCLSGWNSEKSLTCLKHLSLYPLFWYLGEKTWLNGSYFFFHRFLLSILEAGVTLLQLAGLIQVWKSRRSQQRSSEYNSHATSIGRLY